MKHVLTLTLALALLAGCTRHANRSAEPATLRVVRVQTATVQSERIAQNTDVTGTVRPRQRAQLAARVMGSIEAMPVTLGQAVKRGDLLVKITAAEIHARVVQAQSQLNAAQRDLARERDLLGKGASTADTVHSLEDRLTASQAMVREAEAMLSYVEIRAPFDGVVARKFTHAGDLASPGVPLLELEGTSDFEVEAGIPDSLAASLAPGATVAVELSGADEAITGRVTEFSSAADANAHTVTAKIALPAHPGIRSGQFARVLIPGPSTSGLMVPGTAVTAVGQMERVFVAGPDNRAILRLVKTAARRGDRIEVLAGLDAGERVVVASPAGLHEGQPLEIAP